jgi:mycothiol system anti-sigma-R factor
MNCPDCKDKLDRFVDRELTSTELLEVQLHLEGCPDCMDQYEFQANLKRLVKHSCDCDTAPPAFREKLRQLLG